MVYTYCKNSTGCIVQKVLILVVMDGVHIPETQIRKNLIAGLNPCCNGWCTHTTSSRFLQLPAWS